MLFILSLSFAGVVLFLLGWFMSRGYWIEENDAIVSHCTDLEIENARLQRFAASATESGLQFLRRTTCVNCENTWYVMDHDEFRPRFCCYCDTEFNEFLPERESEVE